MTWVAELADGSVIQQAERPDLPSHWTRLVAATAAGGPPVTALQVRFRNRWWDGLPRGARSYYWRGGLTAHLDGRDASPFMLVGADAGLGLVVVKLLVPELIEVGRELRVAEPGDPSLLLNPPLDSSTIA